MPKYRVSVYRTQTFEHTIDAENEEQAALDMTSDSDVVYELMKDHPYDIEDGEWRLDFVEEVETD